MRLYPQPAYEMSAEDRAEEASERDDDAREDYRERLTQCPDFLGEVPMNAQECEAAAAAIKAGDLAELGRVFLRAAEREADEHIAVKSDETGCTSGEAAERLWRIYRPEPQKVAA